jgi:hypothetical protein
MKADSSIFRTAIFRPSAIATILSMCGETQILSGVIEAIAVSMVNDFALGRVHNHPVHSHNCFSIVPDSIEIFTFAFKKLPGIFRDLLIVFGVNDGILVFSIDLFVCNQFYSPKCNAVAFFSVTQQKPDNYTFDERWIGNIKIEIDSGYNNSSFEIAKIEFRDRIIWNAIIYLFYVRIRGYVKY